MAPREDASCGAHVADKSPPCGWAKRLTPTFVAKPWGRRDGLPGPADAQPLGEVVYEANSLGLVVKWLQTSEALSIQVHPRGSGRKHEWWQVIEARPGAYIDLGLKASVSPESLAAAARDGSLPELMEPEAKLSTIVMTDPGMAYDYPQEVDYEIAQERLEDYLAAAEHINALNPDVICVQHEFGIFGGRSGEHLAVMLDKLRAPVVTTLHTILPEPDADQRRVLARVAGASSRLVAMTEMGRTILTRDLRIEPEKISVIPHGIPDLPFLDPAYEKRRFGLDGRDVVLTFGLLSPNKGIEVMIAALPQLVERHPDLTYVILGARILLIPQGARLIGSYDSVVAFGQKRALIVWQRIILPDGSSVRLDNVPATDPSGYAGLADKVDFHTWTLLKGVAISTLLGVGANLTFTGESDLVQAIRESTQQNVSRAGDQVTSRNLQIQPTITIRPGAPVRLIVHRDLILAQWRG